MQSSPELFRTRSASSSPERRSTPPELPVCVQACVRGGSPRPFPASTFPKASHRSADVSSREIRLRAAFSFSGHALPDRRCCHGRALARLQSFQVQVSDARRLAHQTAGARSFSHTRGSCALKRTQHGRLVRDRRSRPGASRFYQIRKYRRCRLVWQVEDRTRRSWWGGSAAGRSTISASGSADELAIWGAVVAIASLFALVMRLISRAPLLKLAIWAPIPYLR